MYNRIWLFSSFYAPLWFSTCIISCIYVIVIVHVCRVNRCGKDDHVLWPKQSNRIIKYSFYPPVILVSWVLPSVNVMWVSCFYESEHLTIPSYEISSKSIIPALQVLEALTPACIGALLTIAFFLSYFECCLPLYHKLFDNCSCCRSNRYEIEKKWKKQKEMFQANTVTTL